MTRPVQTRLVQLKRVDIRRVAIVEEPHLRLLDGCHSVYELATSAVAGALRLSDLVRKCATGDLLDYDPIYRGHSDWRIQPPIDHPGEPSRCVVSGTGLTHLGSARNRQSMHASTEQDLTDSMKMFRWGVEGGRPAPGCIGTAPEWFYKGAGATLRGAEGTRRLPAMATRFIAGQRSCELCRSRRRSTTPNTGSSSEARIHGCPQLIWNL